MNLDDLTQYSMATVAAWATGLVGALIALTVLIALTATRRRHRQDPARSRPRVSGQRWLIGLAVAAALGVAGLGGVRSFEAVSAKFDSPLVPLTADGMTIACTALRLAALTRGWRLPGSLVTTYGFIGGTVWLNVAAAHGWTDAVAHALAPLSYAVLVEFLAHLLRLHLRLAQPSRPRVTALTWFTSPVVTTRVWLHVARTGGDDPVAARALVQQVVRMASRLSTICPSPPVLGWSPFGSARAARAAALQTIRDGLLQASELAALLPDDGSRLTPGALLALVDRTALQSTPGRTTVRTAERTAVRAAVHRSADDPVHTSAPEPVHPDRTVHAPLADVPAAPVSASSGRDGRTDADLVAALHHHAHAHHGGRALSQREVMRVLGVGTPKAKRLVEKAGWTAGPPPPSGRSVAAGNGHVGADGRPLQVEHSEHQPQHITEQTTNTTNSNYDTSDEDRDSLRGT